MKKKDFNRMLNLKEVFYNNKLKIQKVSWRNKIFKMKN